VATADLPSGTVTFLFTDIEGSTRLLKQLRDGYGDLLADHQRLLREAFEQAGGREIDTQGDAFFVAFPRAKDAVSAALAGQRAFASHAWPDGVEVKVRMGIHTGEPALGDERYVGLGVHRAARICAAAHGGQILLSDATRAVAEDELSEGVGLRDVGRHELKDLDRPERLFQLLAPDLPDDFPPPRTGQQETAFAGREGELAEAAQAAVGRARPLRRRTLLLAALAGVLAAAVAIPIFALGQGDGGAEVVVSPNSVAVIDPGSNEVVDAVPVGTGASRVAVGEGAVWVLNSEDRTVSRINPDTLEPATIGTGTTPTDLAVGGGSVWLVTGCPDATIFRLDPGSNQVERLLELRCDTPEVSPSYIAYGDGSLWVANQDEEVLWRIDPEGRAVEAAIPLDAVTAASAGEGIAVGEGAVWVNRAASVVRVDPGTNESRTIDVPHEFGGIAAGEGGVWTADNPITTGTGRNADGTLWRIDPTLEAGVRTIRVGAGPIGVGAGAGSVWVANSQDGTVSRVDPLVNEVAGTIEVGGTPRGVAVGEGAVWVTVG
jgi:YVTN family beta-propeller protein